MIRARAIIITVAIAVAQMVVLLIRAPTVLANGRGDGLGVRAIDALARRMRARRTRVALRAAGRRALVTVRRHALLIVRLAVAVLLGF